MNPKKFKVELLCADGNTVYLYMGDSWLLAIYTYLKHSLRPAEEGSILTLEEHTRV